MNSSNITRDLKLQATTPTVTALDTVQCLLACLLSLFVCTGNAMTIGAIWSNHGLRTLANIYVASLAMADFVVGLSVILLALFLLPTTRLSLFYNYVNVCVLMHGLSIGMIAVSTVHMTFISVDRYVYIAKPYFYQRFVNNSVVMASITLAWGFGLVFSVLPQFIHNEYNEEPLCDVTEVLPIGYLFYATVSIYWILVMVIFVMYALILHTAWKQQCAIQALAIANPGTKGPALSARGKRMKSVRFFLTMFGVFFVCLTPVTICMAVDYYINVPASLYRLLNLLALTNSGMNFIINGVLNREFRQAFFKLVGITLSNASRTSRVFSTSSS